MSEMCSVDINLPTAYNANKAADTRPNGDKYFYFYLGGTSPLWIEFTGVSGGTCEFSSQFRMDDWTGNGSGEAFWTITD